MFFADTHCHLNFGSLQDKIDLVLQRAAEKGLDRILVPGIDFESSLQAIALAETYPMVYAAVGFHPNDASKWDANSFKDLERLAHHPKVLAIGEIGLDFYRDQTPEETQIAVFREQLNLAALVAKPVLIHCREAMSQIWPILRPWQERLESPLIKRPGVFHSFDSDFIIASEIIKYGFFIGVGGPITYRNSGERQKTIGSLPLEKLVLETDAPFLPPHPYRGKPNEPAYIPIIAEKLAELFQYSLEKVAQITSANADYLFQWKGQFE